MSQETIGFIAFLAFIVLCYAINRAAQVLECAGSGGGIQMFHELSAEILDLQERVDQLEQKLT